MQESLRILGRLLEMMRQAVREEIQVLIRDLHEKDRLLTAQEAAQALSVSPDWIYHNARKLPFTRQLGRKMLRFCRRGIRKWIGVEENILA